MPIKYLHTMVRVKDLDASMDFYKLLGLVERRRIESEEGRFTLVYLCPPGMDDSRHFGHLAYSVENIYETCQYLMDNGVTINRPPHDGRMAFIRSPDNISVELLQQGDALEPAEPWTSMGNTGHW